MHTPTSNIDPGPGYRLLEFGETFIAGDQVWTGEYWSDRKTSVGSVNGRFNCPTRRKLPTPDYRWIPVGEKKPERSVTVLLTDCPSAVERMAGFGWLGYLGFSGWVASRTEPPTHWCPLPPALPVQTREDRQVEKYKALVDQYVSADLVMLLTKAFKEALAVT